MVRWGEPSSLTARRPRGPGSALLWRGAGPAQPDGWNGGRQRGGGGGGHSGLGAAAEARVPRRRGRRRHAGHPGRGAAGAHAHHARQFSGALQQPELRGLGQLHGGRLPAGGLRHDPERLRLEHRAHLTLTPGRRYSFGCRYRLGTASNLALSLEGVSQMVYILPERLLALVRPAFDLVLRRIRSLKRCVQA